MAFRTVYGNQYSENQWPMVDEDSCQWITVPGTNPSVSLEIQKGQPLAILRAWAADFNEFVEHLRDADSACWTPTNSVGSSNHLSGSACDLNWNSHEFRVWNAGFNADQIETIREMLDFYEGTVFWGNDWDTPKDAMHFQVGYNTFQNPHTDDFIARKIRADGYSTFRRGNAPALDLAQVLSDAMGDSVSLDRYRELLPAVQQALVACGCNSLNRVAMWMAQLGTESGGLQWMEEIADGSEYEGRNDLGNTQPGDGRKFKGRGPIQVTGRANYAALSAWAFGQGLVPSVTYFTDDPDELSSDRYGFIGVIWYWTVARPHINEMCDEGDLEGVTRAINGGLHGLDDRRNRWNHCLGMGDTLMQLASGTTPSIPLPTTEPSTTQEGFMSALTPEEQRALYNEIMGQRRSLSPLRHVGEGTIGNIEQLEQNMDSSIHVLVTWLLAAHLKSPESLALLREVATNTDPGRQWDAKLAQAMLNKIEMMDKAAGCPVVAGSVGLPNPVVIQQVPNDFPTPPVVQQVVETPPVYAPPVSTSTGTGIKTNMEQLNSDINGLREALNSLSAWIKG